MLLSMQTFLPITFLPTHLLTYIQATPPIVHEVMGKGGKKEGSYLRRESTEEDIGEREEEREEQREEEG